MIIYKIAISGNFEMILKALAGGFLFAIILIVYIYLISLIANKRKTKSRKLSTLIYVSQIASVIFIIYLSSFIFSGKQIQTGILLTIFCLFLYHSIPFAILQHQIRKGERTKKKKEKEIKAKEVDINESNKSLKWEDQIICIRIPYLIESKSKQAREEISNQICNRIQSLDHILKNPATKNIFFYRIDKINNYEIIAWIKNKDYKKITEIIETIISNTENAYTPKEYTIVSRETQK